jgi:hypothetical protein
MPTLHLFDDLIQHRSCAVFMDHDGEHLQLHIILPHEAVAFVGSVIGAAARVFDEEPVHAVFDKISHDVYAMVIGGR